MGYGMASKHQNIGIIGGGLAGLTLAALLAQQGHQVSVFERDQLGGKLRITNLEGKKIATGPSLFTFPEIWQKVLTWLDETDPLQLKPLPDGLGLHHTPFGAISLPVPAGHLYATDWQRYVSEVAPLRPHIADLMTRAPRVLDQRFLRASQALFKVIGPHLTAQKWISKRNYPPALAHALLTHALNAGMAPQDAPALYALIPGLIAHDVARPTGGMGTLLNTLIHFCQRRKVKLHSKNGIQKIKKQQLLDDSGQVHHFETIISAIDPYRLKALRGQASITPIAERTVSGVAVYASTSHPNCFPAMSVLTPSDFQSFKQAIQQGQFPADTLSLVHGYHDHVAILLTTPATAEAFGPKHPWLLQQLKRIEQTLGQDLHIQSSQFLDPAFYALGGHFGGAIYGKRSAPWQAGPFHPQPYRLNSWLWQVGTGVHPGGGIPGVLGSALVVAGMLGDEL